MWNCASCQDKPKLFSFFPIQSNKVFLCLVLSTSITQNVPYGVLQHHYHPYIQHVQWSQATFLDNLDNSSFQSKQFYDLCISLPFFQCNTHPSECTRLTCSTFTGQVSVSSIIQLLTQLVFTLLYTTLLTVGTYLYLKSYIHTDRWLL